MRSAPSNNTSLWDQNFRLASRPRPSFIEEINQPFNYRLSRSTPMKRTASQAYPEKYAAAKRRRAESQRIAMYRALPRGRGVSNTSLQRGSTSEIKSVDIVNPAGGNAQAFFACNNLVSIVPLNLTTQGSAAWQRNGRKIHLKSLNIRGFVNQIRATVAEDDFVRMFIVYDKQANGALPSIQDLLRDQVNAAGDSNFSGTTSNLNLNNRDRFEMIRDWQWWLPATNAATPAQNTKELSFKAFIPLGGRETTYRAESTPGVIGDIATGSLLLVTFGNRNSTEEGYGITLSARLRFYD